MSALNNMQFQQAETWWNAHGQSNALAQQARAVTRVTEHLNSSEVNK